MTELSVQTVGVCIDIGTHKVVGMMAKIREDGIIEIVKMVSRPSRGIKRGVINNIEPITRIIKDIITELERDLKIDVLSVSTSISGSHIRSRKNIGVITLGKDRERFTERDYERILIEAGQLKLDPGESVIHVLPQKYIVDGGEPVENAIGLSGVRFTLIAYLITAATNEITNIRNCIAANDVNVDNFIYEGLSSAISVLTEDECQRGITLIDIGAGVTDVVVYQDGVVVFHDSIPLGGDDVTADIAKLKRFSTQVAESIKIEHGSCMGYASYDGTFTLPVITNQSENRKMSVRELSFIIDARYREILEFVREKIEEAGVYQLHDAGVVLTGGASQMVGCVELARDVMDKPCRIGLPINVSYKSSEPLTPEHAAVVGLLASYKYENIWQKELQKTMPSGNIFSNIYKKIAGICRNYL